MYEFMRGIPESMDAAGNVVFNNVSAGTGYLVKCLRRDWASGYAECTDEIRLIIRARYSEQRGYTLFGFLDINDRTAFDLLTSVKGVAGAGAMAILELYRFSELAALIAAEDIKGIAKANGVGPKLAGQVIAELRGKVADVAPAVGGQFSPRSSAIDALVAIGYKRAEAAHAVQSIEGERCADELVRLAVAKLM